MVEPVVAVVMEVHEPDAGRDKENGENPIVPAEVLMVNDVEDNPSPPPHEYYAQNDVEAIHHLLEQSLESSAHRRRSVTLQLTDQSVVSHPFYRFCFDLSNALARHTEFAPDLFERVRDAVIEPEAHAEDLLLARRKVVDDGDYLLAEHP